MTHVAGGDDREARRKRSAISAAVSTALWIVSLGVRYGPKFAATAFAVLGLGAYAAVELLFSVNRWTERRRRLAGNPWSWSAGLYSSGYRISGGVWPGGGTRDAGLMGGRIYLTESGLRWSPSRRVARAFGAGDVSWDKTWKVETERVWGLGRYGRLTLTHTDGRRLDLWIRDEPDLHKTLASPSVQ